MQPVTGCASCASRISGRAGGFSLIEVLVAILVMGIGVLGVTALQMVSLQNNRSALERGEAVALAYDMMDRIRANPEGAPAGAAYAGLAVGAAPPNPTNCLANVCTQAQLVEFDQASWKCQLGEFHDNQICKDLRTAGVLPAITDQPGLPDGDGSIAVDADGVVTVTVQWSGSNNLVQKVVIDSRS